MSGEYNAVAVIGGGYGDEGKGLMTDFYASAFTNPVVIRSNGGAQAGHTVVTPDGRRHVFSHFGSGTFAGAPTYLSEFFIVNPTLFAREHMELHAKFGITPKVYIHPKAKVTSPLEMLINQSLEHMRGDDPHGSCGIGFGETFERIKQLHLLWEMQYVGQMHRSMLLEDYIRIRNYYVPKRVNLDEVGHTFLEILNSNQLFMDFYSDLQYMMEHVEVVGYQSIWNRNLIFEGAQGLMIDQDYGHFPYVTRSNTGMRNIKDIMEQFPPTSFSQLTVNYVTRAYTTRHGAGPLPFEKPMPDWVVDNTNVHNEWQHGLRYAPLNPAAFTDITNKDFALYGNEHNGCYDVQKVTTVTCVDQFKNNVEIVGDQEEELHFHPGVALQIFESLFDYISQGPTRNDIHGSDDP